MNGNFFHNKLNTARILLFVFVTSVLLLWWAGTLSFVCPIYNLTSFYCTMCRSTRAVNLLLEFKLIDSLVMNPMALFWSYFLVISYIKFIFDTLFNFRKKIELLDLRYYFKSSTSKYIVYISAFLNLLYLNLLQIK